MPVDFETVRQIALAFPGVGERLSYYKTPAFTARKKFLARKHQEEKDALVLMVGEFEQGMLIQLNPDVFYITDHYRGSAAVLVRLNAIDPLDLQEALEKAWRKIALKRDIAAWEARPHGAVCLRDVTEADLPIFYEQQRDPEAAAMAAFPSREREPFMEHWAKIMKNETGLLQTILFDGQVAGNIVSWVAGDQTLIGYWLGKEYWGKNIATRALSAFLSQVKARPLHAYVVQHNVGSRRVLEKCGFTVQGEELIPDENIVEILLKLD